MFFVKCLCVLFVSILLGFCMWVTEKKTTYYLLNKENQKTEITKIEYTYLNNSNKFADSKDVIVVYKEDIHTSKNAISYSAVLFLSLIVLISLFEYWKTKKNASIN